MGRKLKAVFLVSGTLTVVHALHIGGSDGSLVEDMPLARNGRGQLYIPGSSFAGPMRAWWTAHYGKANAALFFGRTPDKANPDEGHASRIVVGDAATSQLETETRDHVRIDAETGAAKEGFKFDRQILPAGTQIGLSLRFDMDAAVEAEGEVAFATLLQALASGQIRFGGGKTRGLGAVELTSVAAHKLSVATPAGVLALAAIKVGTPAIPELQAERQPFAYETIAEPLAAKGLLAIRIAWTSILPVFNLGPTPSAALDRGPLMSGAGGSKQPVLAGSSVKGALRSQAARICRTLFGDASDAERLVIALFGAAGAPSKETKDAESDIARPGCAALSVDDCVVGPAISAADWAGILADGGSDKETRVSNVQRKIDSITTVDDGKNLRQHDWHVNEHVAIDRWTGGAADKYLFNVLSPGAVQAGTLNIMVDIDRIAFAENGTTKRDRNAAIALLLLVLRDLSLGRIPLGFGTTRGNGSIDVASIDFPTVGEAFSALGFSGGLTVGALAKKMAFEPFAEIAEAWDAYCKERMTGSAAA